MTKWFLCFVFLVACTDGVPADDGEPYATHDELSDFDPVGDVNSKGDEFNLRFDEDTIISDRTFTDTEMMSAEDVQNFFENTPYSRPTYLATEIVGDRMASDVVVSVAKRHGINPVMLITRLQVEGSHIARRTRPSQRAVNRALGCGCFDGQSCQAKFLGLERQLDCAAVTMKRLYSDSQAGVAQWRKGKSKRTLDGIRVTPESHATAAMYGYTPWVLPRRGGNWLVWNVTQRFLKHFGGLTPRRATPWVGSACQTDSDCGFESGGSPGFCYDFVDRTGTSRGICSFPCQGFCPDKAGKVFTFCIQSDAPETGICTTRAVSSNEFCGLIPGTIAVEAPRFIGTSSAPASTKGACVPDTN